MKKKAQREKEEGTNRVRDEHRNILGFYICLCFCGTFFNDIQKVKEIALHVLQWGVLRNITESKKHTFFRLLMNEAQSY